MGGGKGGRDCFVVLGGETKKRKRGGGNRILFCQGRGTPLVKRGKKKNKEGGRMLRIKINFLGGGRKKRVYCLGGRGKKKEGGKCHILLIEYG